jgi:uncharacterized protein YndB with AHSA1/START domain
MTHVHDSSREIYAQRTLRAPRELVLKMWSDPQALSNWWGPEGFSTTTHKLDFRPGGEWTFIMHGPDGVDYPNYIKYKETGPDRITYSHGGRVEDPVDFEVEVTLTVLDSKKTLMEFRSTFPSAEERDRVVEEFGAEEGLYQTMDRLVRLVDAELDSDAEVGA